MKLIKHDEPKPLLVKRWVDNNWEDCYVYPTNGTYIIETGTIIIDRDSFSSRLLQCQEEHLDRIENFTFTTV